MALVLMAAMSWHWDYCCRCGLCARALMQCRGLESVDLQCTLGVAMGRAEAGSWKSSGGGSIA